MALKASEELALAREGIPLISIALREIPALSAPTLPVQTSQMPI